MRPKEPLVASIFIYISANDKRFLQEYADEHGANVSGIIRKWIWDARVKWGFNESDLQQQEGQPIATSE